MINVLNSIDCVPSNAQFSHQEALLYVFGDNEAVIKMIFKGRSPTMRHVSRTHRVALDWLFDHINLEAKIQIKYIDTKNQLADILTKGNFTRDEWDQLLSLFNISHFSSTVCSEAMTKRLQQDSGEERVTAKSRPRMSLIARAPSNISSSTSVIPEKRSYGNQNPWSAKAEREERTRQRVVGSDPQGPHLTIVMNNLLKTFFLSTILKVGWLPKLGLLKSGTLTLRCVSDRGNPLSPIGERHVSLNQVSFTRRPSTMEQPVIWAMSMCVTIGISSTSCDRITVQPVVITSRIQRGPHTETTCSTYLSRLVSEHDEISALERIDRWNQDHSCKHLWMIKCDRDNYQSISAECSMSVTMESAVCHGKIH